VKITLNILNSFGINIQENLDENKVGNYTISCEQSYRAQTYEIPGDFSSASFLIAAIVLSPEDSKIIINNLDFDKPQGDQKIIKILKMMGAKIEVFQDKKSIIVTGNLSKYPLTGITIDLEDNPDLFPILSVVGAFAKDKTELCNVSSIRGKESDRIALMAQGLSRMGVKVKEEEDKLIVFHCDQLKGSKINHENDHRIAMALIIAAMWANTPSQISEVGVVEDSYPNFIEDIIKLGAKVEKIE
jgi:3-phosphoshikimate 1-carboxyvinyltransferase